MHLVFSIMYIQPIEKQQENDTIELKWSTLEAAPGFFCRVGLAHPIFASIEMVISTLVILRLMYSTHICCLLSH